MMTLDAIRAATPYELARLAECASPDSLDSAGATFLDSVRTSFIEAVEYGRFASEDSGDVISELANAAPDVDTATKWAEFVDLAAYQEDPSELGADPSDMDKLADICLYIVAERLCRALLDELDDDVTEGSDNE